MINYTNRFTEPNALFLDVLEKAYELEDEEVIKYMMENFQEQLVESLDLLDTTELEIVEYYNKMARLLNQFAGKSIANTIMEWEE